MAGGIAAVGGVVPTLTRNHRYLADVFLCLMVLALGYVISEFFKLKRAGGCR